MSSFEMQLSHAQQNPGIRETIKDLALEAVRDDLRNAKDHRLRLGSRIAHLEAGDILSSDEEGYLRPRARSSPQGLEKTQRSCTEARTHYVMTFFEASLWAAGGTLVLVYLTNKLERILTDV